ncbi:type VI secretion system protein ImpA [Ectopseudomonas composti]|uniref:Type VI secretion protein n=1 Tax=Ectopseudomonas composti TaxID=658457 RepID=A0A1I5R7D0_9GAMM|nr:type VI secretion system protein TssA [Pseudomonas composti]EZH79864.1 type VI secretion protein [Pseudomonas composti]SFP54444.1 type VI secretion system protein ImpA [Pseudomonas composti]
MTSVSIGQYLEPIPGDAICGPSLRYEGAWDRLRELRREDDASLPTGVWQSDLKRGDWAALEHLAGDLLRERSKDLMIAVWLGEAWIRRHGLAGASSAMELLAGLCERYPDTLHPQPEDDDRTWRVFPLEWMIRQYSTILLTRIPLFGIDVEEFAHITLHDWLQLQQRQVQMSDSKQDKIAAEAARLEYRKLHEKLKQTPASHFVAAGADLKAALTALERLDSWSEGWLADLAPSFGPLRQILTSLRIQLETFVPISEQIPSSEPESDAVMDEPTSEPSSTAVPIASAPSSREQAYRQLAQIADYLARTEPHSPVPYVIRRAVEWGNQPLGELLDELISADAESRRIWKLLGVLK